MVSENGVVANEMKVSVAAFCCRVFFCVGIVNGEREDRESEYE